MDSTACLEKGYADHRWDSILGRTRSDDRVDDGFVCRKAVAIDHMFDLSWQADQW
jgi:hypothetical protein